VLHSVCKFLFMNYYGQLVMVTVGLKLDLNDHQASFSALSLLVGSSGL